MGKTELNIKPKTQLPEAQPDPPKKRGRPPKSNKTSQTHSTISQTQTQKQPKVYSLLSNSTGSLSLLMPVKDTIVQLKITREQIEFYESSGDLEDGTLLQSITKFNDVKPVAYNASPYAEVPHQSPPRPQTRSQHQHQHPVSEPVELSVTRAEVRRNLIINSGIQRRVSKLMTAFNNTEWSNYSPYDCWCCCHSFDVAPVGIPIKVCVQNKVTGETSTYSGQGQGRIPSQEDHDFVFYLYGNFCSYNCAARYLNPHDTDDYAMINSSMDLSSNDEKAEQMQLLTLMCQIETGLDIHKKIRLSPPRLSLQKFGGPLTIVEYRKNFTQHNEYHVFKLPLVPINYELEEVNNLQSEYEKIMKKGTSTSSSKPKSFKSVKSLTEMMLKKQTIN